MKEIDLSAPNAMGELRKVFQQTVKACETSVDADSPAMRAAARMIVKEARRLVGETAEDWESSPAGAPPFKHIGRLQRSIRSGKNKGDRAAGSSYFVGRLLEFGTDGDERGPTSPHPWLRPAVENTRNEMPDEVQDKARVSVLKGLPR
jgi:hypothetical protein